MREISPYMLGATLYMPALHKDIHDVIAGRKLPGLRSLVVCLEDALAESDVEMGMQRLHGILGQLALIHRNRAAGPLVFVRPRHIEMARIIAAMPEVGEIDGMVAPKLRPGQVGAWVDAIAHTGLMLMPTLETAEIFDPFALRDLRDELLADGGGRILALRIGGNDLLACLGLRRMPGVTLYDGPLGHLVSTLVCQLAPAGFALTAPVFDIIDDIDTLTAELARDLQFGLVGKTAIHPCQIAPIQAAFAVGQDELIMAERVLADDADAVFKHGGAMCEPATHRAWAGRILERARLYGVGDTLRSRREA